METLPADDIYERQAHAEHDGGVADRLDTLSLGLPQSSCDFGAVAESESSGASDVETRGVCRRRRRRRLIGPWFSGDVDLTTSYTARVEGLFLDAPLIALDEYGIPPELAQKLRAQLKPAGNLDAVLKRLTRLDAKNLPITESEAELVRYAQAGL